MIYHISEKKRFKALIILILAYFAVSFAAFGQTESEIRTSADYYYGEAISDSLPAAKNNALADLTDKILVTISGSYRSVQSEKDEQYSSSAVKEIRTYSRLKLRGINYYEKKLEGGLHKILAYINKDDYENSLAIQRDEISTQYQVARRKEKLNGLISAIPDYYETFLAAYFYPGPLQAEGRDGIIYPDLKTYILGFLKDYYNDIQIICDNVSIDHYSGEMILISLILIYNEQQLENTELKLENPGSTFQVVQNGYAEIITDLIPSYKEEKVVLSLRPILAESNEYYEFHRLYGPLFRKTITVDFKNLTDINFRVTSVPGNALKFEPQIEHLNVRELHWDFGDRSSSKEISPVHKYTKEGVYLVRLTVNSDPGLIRSKFLDQTGNEADEVPSEIIINSLRREPDFVPPVPKSLQELMEKQTVQDLRGIKDSKDVIGYLEVLRSQGKITYGKKSDFISPDQCYLLVYDNELKTISNFLAPQNDGRYDLFTGELIKDVSKKFTGKTGIWLIINY